MTIVVANLNAGSATAGVDRQDIGALEGMNSGVIWGLNAGTCQQVGALGTVTIYRGSALVHTAHSSGRECVYVYNDYFVDVSYTLPGVGTYWVVYVLTIESTDGIGGTQDRAYFQGLVGTVAGSGTNPFLAANNGPTIPSNTIVLGYRLVTYNDGGTTPTSAQLGAKQNSGWGKSIQAASVRKSRQLEPHGSLPMERAASGSAIITNSGSSNLEVIYPAHFMGKYLGMALVGGVTAQFSYVQGGTALTGSIMMAIFDSSGRCLGGTAPITLVGTASTYNTITGSFTSQYTNGTDFYGAGPDIESTKFVAERGQQLYVWFGLKGTNAGALSWTNSVRIPLVNGQLWASTPGLVFERVGHDPTTYTSGFGPMNEIGLQSASFVDVNGTSNTAWTASGMPFIDFDTGSGL